MTIPKLITRGIDCILPVSCAMLRGQAHCVEKLKIAKFKLSYESLPDDIFIVTYPKSGTTWMQMILYQLYTDGSLDNIPHLNLFASYLEDLIKGSGRFRRTAPSQSTWPRIIKTHFRYGSVPKGNGRYIYVVRDGRDVVVSYFHHYRRNGYPGTFQDFFKLFFTGKLRFGTWFDHVSEWSKNPSHLNILPMHFEDLISDLSGSIRRIAEFCSISLDEKEVPRIIRNSSFEFMRLHESKLDIKTRRRGEISPENDHFIRKGQVGDWELLNPAMLGAFEQRFRECVGEEFYFASAYKKQSLDMPHTGVGVTPEHSRRNVKGMYVS